mgnify:FL=1
MEECEGGRRGRGLLGLGPGALRGRFPLRARLGLGLGLLLGFGELARELLVLGALCAVLLERVLELLDVLLVLVDLVRAGLRGAVNKYDLNPGVRWKNAP